MNTEQRSKNIFMNTAKVEYKDRCAKKVRL